MFGKLQVTFLTLKSNNVKWFQLNYMKLPSKHLTIIKFKRKLRL